MLQQPQQISKSIAETWDLFKQKRTSVDLYTEDAVVVYVPTSVGVRGNTQIRKFFLHPHFSEKANPGKETAFNTLMSNDRLIEESIWSVHFHSGACNWLVPGIEDRYLLNATVKFPVTTSVSFVNGKIQSIRYHWDQASVLKQLKVISDKAQWPVTGEQQADSLSSPNTMRLKSINDQEDDVQKTNTPSASNPVPNQFPVPGRVFGPVDPKDQVTRPVRLPEPDAPPLRNIFAYEPPVERPLVAPHPNKLGSSIVLGQDEGSNHNNKTSANSSRDSLGPYSGVAGKPTPRISRSIIG
ncbi:hypothetical protein G6F43_001649 [Rhizopus delemar]|nr:hypothetical protein G6F43_001649 [Rhizopus delemar]